MIVDCAGYQDRCRVVELQLDEVEAWLDQHEGFVWLGLRVPSEEEVAVVAALFDLDEDEVEDLVTPHTRPVMSRRGRIVWLVLRTARYAADERRVILGELTVLAKPGFVVTIRYGQASPLSGLRRELEEDEDLLEGPLDVVAAVVNQVVEDYRPALDGFEQQAIDAEREVFSAGMARQAKPLLVLKRDLRDLFLVVEPLHEPLARLRRQLTSGAVSAAALNDLEEASDKLATMVQRVHTLSDLLDAALDANLAQVGIQQNEDMRKISAWVAMAAVPTLLAGIYGMNFDSMPELRWDVGYPLALAVMAAVVLGLYRFFRRSGWL